jgi:hypothetical protein
MRMQRAHRFFFAARRASGLRVASLGFMRDARNSSEPHQGQKRIAVGLALRRAPIKP